MITRWSILIAIYAAWVLVAALADVLFTNPVHYDYAYWIGERIFVLVTFLTLLSYIEKRYKWIMITLVVVATWKLLYIILVIAGVIKANDFTNVMALIFITMTTILIVKWPR